MRALVASEEKPKAFFPNRIYAFEYNLNFDNIFVKNSNVVFQPIWQPYFTSILLFHLSKTSVISYTHRTLKVFTATRKNKSLV